MWYWRGKFIHRKIHIERSLSVSWWLCSSSYLVSMSHRLPHCVICDFDHLQSPLKLQLTLSLLFSTSHQYCIEAQSLERLFDETMRLRIKCRLDLEWWGSSKEYVEVNMLNILERSCRVELDECVDTTRQDLAWSSFVALHSLHNIAIKFYYLLSCASSSPHFIDWGLSWGWEERRQQHFAVFSSCCLFLTVRDALML